MTLSMVKSSPDPERKRHQADAATHLANERTFLAWSLTAIVIIGSGVALACSLMAVNDSVLTTGARGNLSILFYPATMGLLFLGAGLLILIMATCRYLSVQEQLMQQRFRPSSVLAMTLLVLVLLLCIVLAGYLIHLFTRF